MLEKVYQRFRGGCMMLFSRDREEASFLGTAFLVHEKGYLLTAAHLIRRRTELMVEPLDTASEQYVPVRYETVRPMSVVVVSKDAERDLALLRFQDTIDISAPDHILGRASEAPVGTPLACLGYPFGYQGLHNLVLMRATLASKVISPRENRLLLFDTGIQDGSRGAPLVNVQDGRVIGVVCGRFHPSVVTGDGSKESGSSADTGFSFAVAMGYGRSLLEAEGLVST
jgi:serine protease Do